MIGQKNQAIISKKRLTIVTKKACPFQRVQVVGLVLSFSFAACLERGADDGGKGPPAWTASLSDFQNRFEWVNLDPNHTYLSVEILVKSTTSYVVEYHHVSRWDSASAYLAQDSFVKALNGSTISGGSVDIERVTSCQEYPDAFNGNGCDPRLLETSKITKLGAKRLEAGRYLLLARAYGATSASLTIKAGFASDVEVLEKSEGNTTLLIMLDVGGSPSESEFESRINWTAEEPFLATFASAGKRAQDPDYFARGNQGDEYSFVYALQGPGGCCYVDGGGRNLIEKTFPGRPGNWTFEALGGERSDEGPGTNLLGLVLSPPFVYPDGTLKYYGPCEDEAACTR